VVVTDGARIGRDAIVGAGAIVRDTVPDFHVAAGVPARVIRDRRGPGPAAD
jgi:acetyltransferase-like isoleucine patch superfamily enzyme